MGIGYGIVLTGQGNTDRRELVMAKNATLITIAIVNARNTDGFSLVYVYSDQSESSAQGWYSSYDSAFIAAVAMKAIYTEISIEDRTIEDYNG